MRWFFFSERSAFLVVVCRPRPPNACPLRDAASAALPPPTACAHTHRDAQIAWLVRRRCRVLFIPLACRAGRRFPEERAFAGFSPAPCSLAARHTSHNTSHRLLINRCGRRSPSLVVAAAACSAARRMLCRSNNVRHARAPGGCRCFAAGSRLPLAEE